MRDIYRVYATLIIWVTFGVMTLALFTIPSSVFNNASAGVLLGVLIVLAIAATTGTMAAWDALDGSSSTEVHSVSSSAKEKRSLQNRMTRLVDDLDDDEIYELEALLLDRENAAQHQHHS